MYYSDHDKEEFDDSRDSIGIYAARRTSHNSAGINGAAVGIPAVSSTISAGHRVVAGDPPSRDMRGLCRAK